MLIIPELETLRARDPVLYEALKKLIDGVNTGFQQAGLDPSLPIQKPEKIDLLEVQAADGVFDIKITDNTPKRRGISYFVEYSESPSFENAVVTEVGAGRNLRVMLGNKTLYWRAYSAYPGSQPSDPVYFGAANNPTAVAGGGTLNGPGVQSGSGSGTSSSAGGGYGPTRTSGCTEIGTYLCFEDDEAEVRLEACEDWVVLGLEGRPDLVAHPDTLVSVFVRARNLRLGDLVEVKGGRFLPLAALRSEHRLSVKQVVSTERGVYYGNDIRLHNLKPRFD